MQETLTTLIALASLMSVALACAGEQKVGGQAIPYPTYTSASAIGVQSSDHRNTPAPETPGQPTSPASGVTATPAPVIHTRSGPYGIREFVVVYPDMRESIHHDYRGALVEAFPPPTLPPGSPSLYELVVARFEAAEFMNYGLEYCRAVSREYWPHDTLLELFGKPSEDWNRYILTRLETIIPPPELRAFHEAKVNNLRTGSSAAWLATEAAYRQFLKAVESANADLYPNAPDGWLMNIWALEDGNPCYWPGVWEIVKGEMD